LLSVLLDLASSIVGCISGDRVHPVSMTQSMVVTACIAAALVMAACGQKPEEQPAAAASSSSASVFETMNITIIPKSNQIWELSGNLFDDDGNLDGKRLSDPQWTELKEAAAAMGAAARSLAIATGIKAAPAGVKILAEGTEGAPGAAEVQKSIDADPQGFSKDAEQLVTIADEIVAAATAHDAMKTDDAQGRLTDVCGACHSRFWYPNQPAQ